MTTTGTAEDGESTSKPTDIDRAENVKHLELIQAVVTRLALNSFYIKGWTLTVAAASFGFAVNRIDWRVAAMGAVVVAGFWALDAYYLRQERLFRHLYNHVRRNISIDRIERFSMNLVPFAEFETVRRLRVFFSVTLLVYYPLLVVAGTVLAIVFIISGADASAPPGAVQQQLPTGRH